MGGANWLWERRTPERVEAVIVPPEEVPPPLPDFDRRVFDLACAEVRAEVEEKLAAFGFEGAALPYDPRVSVVAGCFHAYAAGRYDERTLAALVHATVRSLADNLAAALLGSLVAMHGFLTMYGPTVAAEYAGGAALLLKQAGLLGAPLQLTAASESTEEPP